MFLLFLCLVGTALAAPAIPEETILPAESHLLMSPYIGYSAPILPIRTLEMVIEPEENAELPEPEEECDVPKEEWDGPKEEWDGPKEELPELKESEEVKLDIPKPPSFISSWISYLPISLSNFSFPSFIGDWFRPGSPANSPKVWLHPAYYPGAVIIENPKA